MTTVVAQTSSNGRKPSPAQQAYGSIAQSRHDFGTIICMDGASIFSQGHIFDVMQAIFNGTITNDKFCMSRIGQLQPLSAHKLVAQEVNFPSEVSEVKCSPREKTDETTAVERSALQHRNT